MKRAKNVTASDARVPATAKKRGTEKGIKLVTRSRKRSKAPLIPAPITPEMQLLDFKIGLHLLTPEQRVTFFEYHRIRDERAKARSLERAS